MSIDLSTKYLGLSLKNPLVVSACPLCGDAETLQRLEEAGAAAAVLPSLFEEQIEHDEQELNKLYEYQTESFAESLSHFPELNSYNTGTKEYLDLIEAAKKKVKMPLIGSLNGASIGGWTRYAKSMQDAGADALELNIYFVPTDPQMSAKAVEDQYVELVAGREGHHRRPAGGQDGSLLHVDAGLGAAHRGRGRRRAGAVQPLPGARYRPGIAAGGSEPGAQQPARTAAATAVDRHPPRPDGRSPWPPPAVSTSPTT